MLKLAMGLAVFLVTGAERSSANRTALDVNPAEFEAIREIRHE